MRIISDFHDYYDTAMGFGQDLSLVYLRKPQTLVKYPGRGEQVVPPEYEFMLPELSIRHMMAAKEGTFTFYPVRVAFAGKVYNGVQVFFHPRGELAPESHTFYTVAEMTAWVEFRGHSPISEVLNAPSRNGWRKWAKGQGTRSYESKLEEFLEKQGDPAYDAVLSKTRKPILISARAKGDEMLIEDGPLAPLDFYRVLPAPLAYQELAMWLGARMTDPSQPPLEISDAVRAQQHGFDCRSFRKPPSNKAKPKACPDIH